MLDTGITVRELNQTVREKSARIASKRVVRETGRESKSRVSIMTGLPRSEVTKILNSREAMSRSKADQHPARRLLAAWFSSPRFADKTGEPATLPIFGKRRSFESLVERHGGGIPVRAMLDELRQMNAIEQLADQQVRAISRVPILSGLSDTSIAAVGERGNDLLKTLTHNVRRSATPLFEATAVIEDSDLDMVSFIRREIAAQGTNFINGATSLLNRARKKRNTKVSDASLVRLGVTVFYFQDSISESERPASAGPQARRKNLRRRPRRQDSE